MTNFDKITQSPETLADSILRDEHRCAVKCPKGYGKCTKNRIGFSCHDCILEWLNQEADQPPQTTVHHPPKTDASHAPR